MTWESEFIVELAPDGILQQFVGTVDNFCLQNSSNLLHLNIASVTLFDYISDTKVFSFTIVFEIEG